MRTKNFTRFLPLLLLVIFFIGGVKHPLRNFTNHSTKPQVLGLMTVNGAETLQLPKSNLTMKGGTFLMEEEQTNALRLVLVKNLEI